MSRKPAAGGGGTTVVGQHHKPAAPTLPTSLRARGFGYTGTTGKQPTSKHGGTRRKHHGKKRGLAMSGLPVCAAQALVTLLGLSDAEVLDLYWQTADGSDDGASIEATLRALSLRGRDLNPRPAAYGAAELTELLYPASLILGLELPGSHAVAVTPDGTWWSWGEPFDPADWPGLVVEEAWAVTLS